MSLFLKTLTEWRDDDYHGTWNDCSKTAVWRRTSVSSWNTHILPCLRLTVEKDRQKKKSLILAFHLSLCLWDTKSRMPISRRSATKIVCCANERGGISFCLPDIHRAQMPFLHNCGFRRGKKLRATFFVFLIISSNHVFRFC